MGEATQGLRSPYFEDAPSTRLPGMLLHAWMCHRNPRSTLCDEESSVPPTVLACLGALREARGDWADSVGVVHVEPAQGVGFGVHVAEVVRDSASGVDHTLCDDVSVSEH